MMKYIYNKPETLALLDGWAGDVPLVAAAYFFWRSGDRLERSQEGLLRSLLYMVFSAHPHLMVSVLKDEWGDMYSWKSGEAGAEDPSLGAWETGKLRDAFRRLLAQKQSPLKLFFLIDGLDEYEDGNVDEIIELFTKDVATSPNAKALVSSRPLVALSSMSIPRLTLHRLNQDDIGAYVEYALKMKPPFQAAANRDPENAAAAESFIQYILDTAGGLFLWAVLVVEDVLKTLAKPENSNTPLMDILDALKKRLPPVLDEVYKQTWQHLPGGDREEASQILQVVLCARTLRRGWAGTADGEEPLTLLDIALAKGDPLDIVKEIKPWGDIKIQDTCRPVAKTFMTKWPGLITLGPNEAEDMDNPNPGSRIRYAHRSAMEYLNQADTKLLLREATSHEHFCPFLAHLKAHVQHLKILRRPTSPDIAREALWTIVTLALAAANRAEADEANSSTYSELLNQLDQTMKHHHEALYKDEHGRWIETTLRSARGDLEKSDKGRDSKRRAEMHWSNFSAHFTHSQTWQDSYLSLAVQFGLTSFVKKAIAAGDGKKEGRPLLHYAVSPLPIAQNSLITHALVEVLLKDHVNINKKFEHATSWQNALAWQYQTFVDGKGRALGGATEAREVAELRLRIVLLLIDQGADVRATVVLEEPKRNLEARKALVDAFRPWTKPESFLELTEAFDAAVAAAKTGGFLATFGRLAHHMSRVVSH